ncbi:DUF4142 domain-containing protein [Advenella mimigardefordensis]|uniref:DUF4142 domain-containing protein n=1 Tax=Advenella mimigardefordensis (strain DSM 17166 / LMG 22922 / DPN7) TaxID=1247726 RepID=W0PBM3_ADVMD|nr:DUF4142 domain-containing protein [Advenella mimigardefordensis]AHG64254.1 hypothetical protein MIM_c21760 [Advenella mimigardefordensis DPN7]
MKSLYMGWILVTALSGCASAATDSGPTDAQIAAIVVTANQVDVDAGKLAASTSASKDVRSFANLMVADHSAVNRSATELVQKLNVKPQPSQTSSELQAAGDGNLAKLKLLKGAAFDKAYIDNEVTYHEAVLDALDKTLIPDADNAELKALLIKVRPAFVAHLAHAKHLQGQLK